MTDYIIKDFEPLTLKSSMKAAKKLCNNFAISHIPVVENLKLIGCFSYNDVQTSENKNQKIIDLIDVLDHYKTDTTTPFLELLKVFSDNDTNIIPVLHEHKYVGYYELNGILNILSSSPFLTSDGFILVIEKNNQEYSMSEIAQIVESNNGTLLGSFISGKNNDTVELTLKIASQEINEIIQTFRRYKYLIITEHKDDFYLEELKNRSDYLQKYLNT